HLAAAEPPRHLDERQRAVEADRLVPERRQRGEIAARAAAEVEDAETPAGRQMAEQRRDVLADIVIARAFPEGFGAAVVVRDRGRADAAKLVAVGAHARGGIGYSRSSASFRRMPTASRWMRSSCRAASASSRSALN